MDYELFQSMSKVEAGEFLDSFLKLGNQRCVDTLNASTHFTVEIDFSLESLTPVLTSVLATLRTMPKEPDPTLPKFIRESDTYKQNLFEFDECSKPVILAAAYYLGECFVRNYCSLSWGVGNSRFHQCNMPVVKGFRMNQELPVILVTENIFGSIFAGMNDVSSIGATIGAWKDSVG